MARSFVKGIADVTGELAYGFLELCQISAERRVSIRGARHDGHVDLATVENNIVKCRGRDAEAGKPKWLASGKERLFALAS